MPVPCRRRCPYPCPCLCRCRQRPGPERPHTVADSDPAADKCALTDSQRALATAVAWYELGVHKRWGPSLLCAYEAGTGKTRAALHAAATWIRNGDGVVEARGASYRIAYCIVRKATLDQWDAEWKRLVESYNDFLFLPTHDPAVPSSFSDAHVDAPRPPWQRLPRHH